MSVNYESPEFYEALCRARGWLAGFIDCVRIERQGGRRHDKQAAWESIGDEMRVYGATSDDIERMRKDAVRQARGER